MDLGMVQSRLQAGKYRDAEAFSRDVRLIWANCKRCVVLPFLATSSTSTPAVAFPRCDTGDSSSLPGAFSLPCPACFFACCLSCCMLRQIQPAA